MSESKKYHIFGAGPAGLAVAYYLSKSGESVIVYESKNIVGGMARSWVWHDFILDTGPHIMHSPTQEIWDEWKQILSDNLLAGQYYSANIKRKNSVDYYFDYPLNKTQLIQSKYWGSRFDALKDSFQTYPNSELVANALSFFDYVSGLAGPIIASEFFDEYPSKVWGISPKEMLADWAPKRIRICSKREPFFGDQFCGICKFGTGDLMNKLANDILASGGQIHLNHHISDITTQDDKIISLRCNSQRTFQVGGDDVVINTLPLSTISKMLGYHETLDFRGIVSTYLAYDGLDSILQPPYNWVYVSDKDSLFNRITEPTSLTSSLNLNSNNKRTYLIAETTFDSSLSKAGLDSLCNKLLSYVPSQVEDILNISHANCSAVTQNVERFVYPIQDSKNKLAVKKINTFVSKFVNLDSIGTGGNFAYNDMQVIFKQAKDMADSLAGKTTSLSRLSFSNLSTKSKFSGSISNSITLNQPNYDNFSDYSIIAEIGINHNGSHQRFLDLVKEAIKCSDYIKFQYFKATSRVGRAVKELNYVEKAQDIEENISELLQRCEIPLHVLKKAFHTVLDSQKIPMCTAFDLDGFDELIEIGFTNIKIASMDLNNYPLHRHICNYSEPLTIFLSTGMSSPEEITFAVEIYRQSNHKLVLLACTSSYPCPKESANLSNIINYRDSFPEFSIGYSDHTVGIDCAFYALILGAKFVEMHFTDSVESFGPDHLLSKSSNDIHLLKNKFLDFSTSFGQLDKVIQPCEYETWRTQKKSLYALTDIQQGSLISYENTYLASPPLGISPTILEQKKNLTALSNIPKDSPIDADLFENPC